jgi:hypothetical protein
MINIKNNSYILKIKHMFIEETLKEFFLKCIFYGKVIKDFIQ